LHLLLDSVCRFLCTIAFVASPFLVFVPPKSRVFFSFGFPFTLEHRTLVVLRFFCLKATSSRQCPLFGYTGFTRDLTFWCSGHHTSSLPLSVTIPIGTSWSPALQHFSPSSAFFGASTPELVLPRDFYYRCYEPSPVHETPKVPHWFFASLWPIFISVSRARSPKLRPPPEKGHFSPPLRCRPMVQIFPLVGCFRSPFPSGRCTWPSRSVTFVPTNG